MWPSSPGQPRASGRWWPLQRPTHPCTLCCSGRADAQADTTASKTCLVPSSRHTALSGNKKTSFSLQVRASFLLTFILIYFLCLFCSFFAAGSGFGDGAESLPFLVGDWSRDFGYAAMPFDAILIGSRMMVAREARTSPGAKALIVAAPGASDQALWEQSYDRPVGGVVTVKSELGEPIHKIATRGVMLWKEVRPLV